MTSVREIEPTLVTYSSVVDSSVPTRAQLFEEVFKDALVTGEAEAKSRADLDSIPSGVDIDAEINVRKAQLRNEEAQAKRSLRRVTKRLGQKLDAVTQQLEGIQAEISRLRQLIAEKEGGFPSFVYFGILLILIATEYPALLGGVQEIPIDQWIHPLLALMLSVILAFCAHFLGTWLYAQAAASRGMETGVLRDEQSVLSNRANSIITGVFLLAIVLFIFALSFARQLGFELWASRVGEGSGSNPTAANFILIAAQIVIFVVAVLVSIRQAPYEERVYAQIRLLPKRISAWRVGRKKEKLEEEKDLVDGELEAIDKDYEAKMVREESLKVDLERLQANTRDRRRRGHIQSDHTLDIEEYIRTSYKSTDVNERSRGNWLSSLIWKSKWLRRLLTFLIGLSLLLLILAALAGLVAGVLAILGVI